MTCYMTAKHMPFYMGEEKGPATPNHDDGQGDGDTAVLTRTEPKTEKPSMYKVIMMNDDYTPMEFVVELLKNFFSKSHEEASRIMMAIHKDGSAVCGIYTYEVAETKLTQVMDHARKNQHPLQCTIEKD